MGATVVAAEGGREPAPGRILIVRVGALGDTLMVTPLLRLLHRLHPQAEIDFLCSGLAAPLLELNPFVTHLFPLKGRNTPLAVSLEKRRLVRRLCARDYDLAVLLESAPRYRALVAKAAPRRIRSFDDTPFDGRLHAVVNNLRAAGLDNLRAEDLDMDLPLAPEDQAAAARMLQDLPAPRIAVHIGWGPLGRKRDQALRLRGWDPVNFADLIRMLLKERAGSVILTGSKEDAKDTQILRDKVGDNRVCTIAGKTTIREMAAVIQKVDMLISVDSGPCHMAAALGTPLVVLWGPGRLEQTRPLSSVTPIQILRHPVACAPCQSTPLQKTCRRNLCMEAISPQEVFEAARRLYPALSNH